MNITLIFLIGISLSMDAFSLALAYGTISLTKKEISTLSIIVGIYHFFMPILGMFIGEVILNIIPLKGNILTLIIFVIIGFNMLIESLKNEDKISKMKIGEMILFGLAVSIDSFSLGIGMNNISNNYIICSIIFSLTSLIFTYIGLILGNKLNEIIGKLATIIGGITLIILGVCYAL